MGVLILDGSQPGDETAQRVRAALATCHPDARTLVLRDLRIGNCAGDFLCWVRSPGMCNVDDDNRIVAAELIANDQVVLLSPVTFGGYSSILKQAMDHMIQTVSPLFTSIRGETHHRRRYRRYPDLATVGWMSAPEPRLEQVFRHLTTRNSINLHAPRTTCDVLIGDVPEQQLLRRAATWLPASGGPPRRPSTDPGGILPDDPPDAGRHQPPRDVVLLVGSPRTTTSNSHFVGRHLAELLIERGANVTEVQIYTAMASRRREAAFQALDSADLVLLACPVYADSLPGPVTAALERLHARSTAMSSPDNGPGHHHVQRTEQRLVALTNCGFPEPEHNRTALAICAAFARSIGVGWSGGLAVGGGEGVIARRPLDQRGRTAPLRQSLALTADELAAGRCVPPRARALLDRPLIAPTVYRAISTVSWLRAARRYRRTLHLAARPYEPDPPR